MSRTTVFVVGRDGEVHFGRAFPNSWWSAWFVWRALWQEYYGGDLDPSTLHDPGVRLKLNALLTDPRLSRFEQIALGTTLDYVMIRRAEAGWVADALDAFAARYERRRGSRGLTTLPQQAAYLRAVTTHPGVDYLCWQQTTALPEFWVKSDGFPYNVHCGHDHWLLFDRYPQLRPTV